MHTPSNLFSPSCIFNTLLHVHAFKPILLQLYIWYVTPCTRLQTYSPPVVYLIRYSMYTPSNLFSSSCIFNTLLHVHAFKPILLQLYIWYVTPCTRLQTYSPPVVYLIRYSMYTPSNLFSSSCIFDTLLHVHAFKPILPQLYIWYVTPCTRLQTYSPPVVYLMAMAIRRAALHISSVAMLIRRAALHTSSVAMLIRRAALHISSVKMAYLQSIRRTSTCKVIYLRGGGTDNILGGGPLCMR